MALAGIQTQPTRELFSIYSCYFVFYYVSYFYGHFVFSHMKLERKTFDHTACAVNIRENATKLQQMVQRVDESWQ